MRILILSLLTLFTLASLRLQAAVVEVPLIYNSGHLFVDVQFEGEPKTRRFMFDTGASVCVFWGADVPGALSFDEQMDITDIHGNRSPLPMTPDFACSIGGYALDPGIGMRQPPGSQQLACMFPGVDGVLGMSVLRYKVIRFDYGTLKLWVADKRSELPKLDGQVELDNYVQRNAQKPRPLINLGKYKGKQLELALIDTGSDSELDLDSLTLASLQQYVQKAHRQRGGSMTVGLHSSDMKTETEYCFSGWQPFGKKVPEMKRGTASWHNLVGAKALQNYIWTIDFGGERAWVAPCAPCMPTKPYTGLAFDIFQAEVFTVSGIFDGTAADASDIEIGWQLLAINGVELNALGGFCEKASRLRAEMYAKPPYTLDFQTPEGKRKRVELLPKVLCE